MIFKTTNSAYETDPKNKKIRRLNGKNIASDRQGNDYEWKDYQDISFPTVGNEVVIVWSFEKDIDGSIRAKSTITSAVVSIVSEKGN